QGSRCCKRHLDENVWDAPEILESNLNSFNAADVEEMVDSLRKCALQSLNDLINFEFVDDMSDAVVIQWTSLNKLQFNELKLSVNFERCSTPNTALALY